MSKEKLDEAMLSKFISLVTKAIAAGKTDDVIKKVPRDKELQQKIKNADKAYKDMIKYMKKKYGKEFVQQSQEKVKM